MKKSRGLFGAFMRCSARRPFKLPDEWFVDAVINSPVRLKKAAAAVVPAAGARGHIAWATVEKLWIVN